MSHFYTLSIPLLLVTTSVVSAQHYGALWCHQGSEKEFEPAQCEAQTLDCFKFSCDHAAAGFVARGCGVSLTRTATGMKNESCNQALAQCQAINGRGECYVCSDKHMCNSSMYLYLNHIIILTVLSYLCII